MKSTPKIHWELVFIALSCWLIAEIQCNESLYPETSIPYYQLNEWWETIDEGCASTKRQSPIALETATAKCNTFAKTFDAAKELNIEGASLINNGYEPIVKFTYKLKNTPAGNLSINGLHFHYGNVDYIGSEHSINGLKYPMEMHITTKVDGTNDQAVLGFMFDISDKGNPNLENIIERLPEIETCCQNHMIRIDFNIGKLLSEVDLGNYFHYLGSLTTPPCTENVKWYNFKDPIEISANQMKVFRMLQRPESQGMKALANNFRPIKVNNPITEVVQTCPHGIKQSNCK